MSMLDSLISYWPLDEVSGNAIDAHGSNDLTETSGTIDATTGKVGGCRDFEEGDTEHFARTDNTDLSTGDIDFSFACWVQFESLTSFRWLISKDDRGSNREYGLYYDSGVNRLNWYVRTSGGSAAAVNADVLGAPSTATWYLVICWHDAVNNQIGIQVNNGTASTASHSGGVADLAAPFLMGATGSNQFNHDGLLDEVAFAKRIWTADEKTWIYNSGNGRSYADWVATAGGATAPPPTRRKFRRAFQRAFSRA